MNRRLSYLLLAAIAAWLAGLCVFNSRINSFEINREEKTDAIVVLTGGRNRLKEAIELLNGGLAEKLFISGVSRGISLQELQKKQQVAIKGAGEITLDEKSTNTVENAIETARWLQDNHIASIRLVTSNYHMPRSMDEFRVHNPGLQILVHPVYSDKVARHWWKTWRSFMLIASEYNKFLYVWLKNRLTYKGD